MADRARLTPPRQTRTDWTWHDVKSLSLKASMLFGGDRRMEAENFFADGFAIRLAITSRSSGWTDLQGVARIWQPSRLKGIQVSPEFGVPFLAATQVFDMRPVPRKWLSLDRTSDHVDRFVHEGVILLSRSGNVGRATLAHRNIKEFLISDDLLRVDAYEPDWRGWIYAYLRAPTVRSMMKAARYGHIIKHLETHHLDKLPVLRLRRELRLRFNKYMEKILELREQAHRLMNEAETTYQNAIGRIPDCDTDTFSFVTKAQTLFNRGRRLEGNFHNPFARAAEQAVKDASVQIGTVGNLVKKVFVPGRFKHIYGEDGVPYLDSAQVLEAAPDIDKRVLSLKAEKQAEYFVERGTLLMPCSGQLHGIIGRVILATDWHENKVLTNHLMRIVPKPSTEIRVGYLQAVLAHPVLGRPRVLKGAFGSSVPELAPKDLSALTVPRLSRATEDKIADSMEQAANDQAQADQLEGQISVEAEEFLQRFLAGVHENHMY